MSAVSPFSDSLSYDLYLEIAQELGSPVDERLSVEVRYELYNSKLLYLERLREHCFQSLNRKSLQDQCPFGPEDLAHIQTALRWTHEHQRKTIQQALVKALNAKRSWEPDDSCPTQSA
jgi:hypothetical protein